MRHGQGNWQFFKYNRSKISTPTLNKTVLSSSAAHTPYTSNLTQTSISSQIDNGDITTNKNKNNTSNTDDIHSCVTPQKQNYSVHAKSTTTHLTPSNATRPIAPVELHTRKKYAPLVNNICVFRFTVDLLMLPSV